MKTQAKLLIYSFLLVFILIPRALTQEGVTNQRPFGCYRNAITFADLNRPSKIRLLAVTDKEEIASASSGAFHIIYDKIDAEKYKFGRVDFYVKQEKPKEPDFFYGYLISLSIYIKINAADGLWWKIVNDDNDFDSDFLTAYVYQDSEEATRLVTILPATGNQTIPLFDIQWDREGRGVSTRYEIDTHVLLDLRSAPPNISADLACVFNEGGGVCGVWDNSHQDRNKYECEWAPTDHDFRCEQTIWNDGDEHLRNRQIKSWFHLLSGNEIAFSVPAGNPTTLQEFAEFAERDPVWRTRRVELPGLGETSHILRLAAIPGRVIHILGTYGEWEPFGTRFFYVILSKDTPKLGYATALSPFSDNSRYAVSRFSDDRRPYRDREITFQREVSERQKLPVANRIEIGSGLGFNVKELRSEARTHIYQITAREETKRAVYWLAIDDTQADGQTLVGMAKLAGNGMVFMGGCDGFRNEDSAAEIKVIPGRNFRTLIDVEPSHAKGFADDDGFEHPTNAQGVKAEGECPYSVHLEWNHKEWVIDEPKKRCPANFSPRNIKISDDGAITATPAMETEP